MGFAKGPYAKQANLPPPATTKLVSSEKIDATTRRYVRDADGNPEPQRDTAARVQMIVAYATEDLASGLLDARTQRRAENRVRSRLAPLVTEGAIRDLRVAVVSTGAGKQRIDVRYYDVLRSAPRELTFGPGWFPASWTAGTPNADGTITLASWMSYECATANTTAQTSASTLRTGFAANAPRGYSRDGSTWYLLPEPDTDNLITDQDLNTWTAVGTPGPVSATGPDGSTGDYEVEDNDAGAAERLRFLGITVPLGVDVTASAWHYVVSLGGGATDARFGWNQTPNPDAWVLQASTTPDYVYGQATVETTATSGEFNLYPATSPNAGTGVSRFFGIQLEQRSYATSYIDGTRAAAVFAWDTATVCPHGFFDVEFTVAPPWAHSAFATEHDWLHFDGSDNRLYFDGSDDKLKLVVNGVEIESSALTWAAHTAITVRVASLSTGMYLAVTGADSGDGTTTGSAAGRIAPPGSVYFGGDSSGMQQSLPVSAVNLYAHAA